MNVPRTFRCAAISYSLRTLMLAVTAVAVWLSYEVDWITQRHAFLAQHPAEDFAHQGSDGRGGIVRRRAPSWLWLFGEEGVLDIEIRLPEAEVFVDVDGQRAAHPSHPVIAKAIRLFPEADISAWTIDFRKQLSITTRVMHVESSSPQKAASLGGSRRPSGPVE